MARSEELLLKRWPRRSFGVKEQLLASLDGVLIGMLLLPEVLTPVIFSLLVGLWNESAFERTLAGKRTFVGKSASGMEGVTSVENNGV